MYARKQKTGRRTGFLCMAGVAGLEPTNGGIKTRCLTNLAIPQFLSSCPMWRTRYLCCSNLSNSGERFTPFATKLCQVSGILALTCSAKV